MKRFLCILLAIGVCMLSFAYPSDKNNSKKSPKQATEKKVDAGSNKAKVNPKDKSQGSKSIQSEKKKESKQNSKDKKKDSKSNSKDKKKETTSKHHAVETSKDVFVSVVDWTDTLSLFVTHAETILTAMKYVKAENDSIKTLTARLDVEKNALENEKRVVEQLLSTKEACRMLIKYPLTEKYNPALINQSLSIIDRYKVTEQKENKIYCDHMLPVLKDYGNYYNEIFKIVSNINLAYVKYNRPYTINDFNDAFETTTYYKKCSSQGKKIPYLEGVKDKVCTFIKEDRLTVGNLTELINEMKIAE